MQASLFYYDSGEWLPQSQQPVNGSHKADLVLCFGQKELLANPDVFASARMAFPEAQIALCSTAGEIWQDHVRDGSVVAVSIGFSKTKVEAVSVDIGDYDNTYAAAIALARQLPQNQLKYVLVLSDGSRVNGSELVKGLTAYLDKKVLITGGLAGDGAAFHSTLVGLNNKPEEGKIVAIGLYGDQIYVTHGSQGGWDSFGLEKRVTNASANVLVELGDQNALDLYKKYLGPESAKLPASALLFPLSVILPGTREPVVRTILSINEENKHMTFAGDIPVGSRVRFMKANFNRLTLAASEAAHQTILEQRMPDFSLLISCVGRKLVLQQQTSEEIKAIDESFQHQTVLAGFYSYGEISPFNAGGPCQLHNQTMTITSFYEN